VNQSLPRGLVLSAACVATACLAACTGSLFQSKAAAPTIYTLSGAADAPAAAMAGAQIPADLAILKPRPRTGLESDRIAVSYPDRRLDYIADARWNGTLSEVLQDFAVQEFRARANLRTVSADPSVFASAYWLEIEVTDFQAEYAGAAGAPTAHVRLLARVGNSADRRVLGQFTADASQPAAENRMTAIVDAYSRAAAAAMTQIVDATAAALGRRSEAR
jgi:ABC-type uncharacterized transport system auxiliary subunit